MKPEDEEPLDVAHKGSSPEAQSRGDKGEARVERDTPVQGKGDFSTVLREDDLEETMLKLTAEAEKQPA